MTRGISEAQSFVRCPPRLLGEQSIQTLNGYGSDCASGFHLASRPDARRTSIEVHAEKCATSHQRVVTLATESEDWVTWRATLSFLY